MNILVALDSFKGSISAVDGCACLASSIQRDRPGSDVVSMPVADGGEGTEDVLLKAMCGHKVNVKVVDPLGIEIDGEYGAIDATKTAVVEMAKASGLELLSPEQYDPMHTTTYGTGQMIRHAIENGYKKIILTVGGSATNDGGLGALMAMGAAVRNEADEQVCFGARGLGETASIDVSCLKGLIRDVTFVVACDVENTLLGPNGATYVFSPQKGASQRELPIMEENMKHYSRVVAETLGKDLSGEKGSGAGGGMGFAMMAFTGARFESGIDMVMEMIGADERIKKADLVITGEGRMDLQTLNGKAPLGILKAAGKYDKKVVGLCGTKGEGWERLIDAGFYDIVSLTEICGDETFAFRHPKEVLSDARTVKKTLDCI